MTRLLERNPVLIPAQPVSVNLYSLNLWPWLYSAGLDAPLDLTVTASTDNTISLLWAPVRGPLDHYRVSYTSSTGETKEMTVSNGLNTAVLTDLEPGTEYTITVSTQRGRQQSTAASIDAFTGDGSWRWQPAMMHRGCTAFVVLKSANQSVWHIIMALTLGVENNNNKNYY